MSPFLILRLAATVALASAGCDDLPVNDGSNRNASDLFHTIISMSTGEIKVHTAGSEQYYVTNATNETCEVYFEHSRFVDHHDWINDFLMSVSSFTVSNVEIKGASGFVTPYLKMRDQVQSKMNATCGNYTKARFVGYSRGGGLATLAAASALSLGLEVELWTWGALRILHQDSKPLFQSPQFAGHRFVYGKDPWTKVPCDYSNIFVHVGNYHHCEQTSTISINLFFLLNPATYTRLLDVILEIPQNLGLMETMCLNMVKHHMVNGVDHLRYPFPSNQIELGYLIGQDDVDSIPCDQGKCNTMIDFLYELFLRFVSDPAQGVRAFLRVVSGCMHENNC